MKRSLGLVSALVLSSSLALGSAGVADAAPAKVLTKAQLRASLLTVKDLPRGFRVDHSSDTSSSDDMTFTGAAGCDRFVKAVNDDTTSSDDTAHQATRDFARGGGAEAVESGVESFASVALVKAEYDAITAVMRTCHQLTLHDPSDGMTLHLKVGVDKFKVDGQRAFLLTMHARYMGVPMDFALTGAQVRNNEVSIFSMGVEQSAAAQTHQAKSLLGTAVEKLSKHLR